MAVEAMIMQQFTSGLGNQMFQYAFFLYLKQHYPEEMIKADLTWFRWHSEHQGFELEKLFNVGLPAAGRMQVLKCSGVLPQDFAGSYYINRIFRLFTEKHYKKYHIDEMQPGTRLAHDADWYLTGFYTSEIYYRDNLELLRRKLVFPECECTVMRDRMKNANSVSVHVRRGDYTSSVYSGKFVNLGMDYYKKAAAVIREKVADPEFFIFSDDKEYISSAFDWLDNKCIVSGNDGADSWKDMYLMSQCHHNILANSTFSTWGALLNSHADALVLYPAAYLSDADNEEKTMPGWIRI